MVKDPGGQHRKVPSDMTMIASPELEAAKLWRDVIRRRRMLSDAAPADVEAATTAYTETLAAYRAVKRVTV